MCRERVNRTDTVFFSRPCFRDVLNLLSESLTQGGWRNTTDVKKVLVIGPLKQITGNREIRNSATKLLINIQGWTL